MGLRVNQNIMGLTAWRYLTVTDWQLAKSIERLSSGLRINRAADDPANYLTSERMRAQVEGMTQALSNVVDSISMTQTVEGAFDEIEALLRSMRALTLHALNTGPNDPEAIANDQLQIQNAIESLQNIASTRKYGNKVLLDGGLGKTGFVGGAQGGTFSEFGSAFNIAIRFRAAGIDTITTQQIGVLGPGGGATYLGTIRGILASGKAGAGLPARYYITATATFASGQASLAQDETLTINGVRINLTAGMNGIQARNRINEYTQFTGVSAALYATAVAGVHTATFIRSEASAIAADNMDDIYLRLFSVNPGSEWTIDVVSDVSNLDPRTSGFGGVPRVLTRGQDIDGEFQIHYFKATGGGYASATAFISARGRGTVLYPDDITLQLNIYGKGWTNVALNGLKLEMTGSINSFINIITGSIRASGGSAGVYAVGLFESPLRFQIGPNADEYHRFVINDMRPLALGNTANLVNINVQSARGAQHALDIIEEALNTVLEMRGRVGAFQKQFLESTKGNLMVYRENYMAAESNIRDTDMALEMVYFTRHQILMQSGTAMLAQANLAPQSVLTLLR